MEMAVVLMSDTKRTKENMQYNVVVVPTEDISKLVGVRRALVEVVLHF